MTLPQPHPSEITGLESFQIQELRRENVMLKSQNSKLRLQLQAITDKHGEEIDWSDEDEG